MDLLHIKDFISVETSHKENPLLHPASRSCANLGPDWDVSLQRSFQSHSLNFLKPVYFSFPFLSLVSEQVWLSHCCVCSQAKPHQEIFLPQDTWDAQLCPVQRSAGATIHGNVKKKTMWMWPLRTQFSAGAELRGGFEDFRGLSQP